MWIFLFWVFLCGMILLVMFINWSLWVWLSFMLSRMGNGYNWWLVRKLILNLFLKFWFGWISLMYCLFIMFIFWIFWLISGVIRILISCNWWLMGRLWWMIFIRKKKMFCLMNCRLLKFVKRNGCLFLKVVFFFWWSFCVWCKLVGIGLYWSLIFWMVLCRWKILGMGRCKVSWCNCSKCIRMLFGKFWKIVWLMILEFLVWNGNLLVFVWLIIGIMSWCWFIWKIRLFWLLVLYWWVRIIKMFWIVIVKSWLFIRK